MQSVIDMLIRIKNAQMSGSEHVSLSLSNAKFKIANVLKDSGYLGNVEKRKKKGRKSDLEYLLLQIKYTDGRGVLGGMKLISKPSRRIYIQAEDIKPVRSGHGISIISTSKGIMSSIEAKKKNLGGELMFEVW